MKKLISTILCLCLAFSLCAVAYASGEPSGEPSGSLAGTYGYEETNGYGLEIAWTLVLNDDGTYALSEENLVVGKATYTGTYTANGIVADCGPMAEDGPEVFDWADPAGFVVTVISKDAFVPGDQSASGEASGPSGEMQVQFFAPTNAYTKDFEGYRQYCIDGFLADMFHPAELEESTVAEFEAMTEQNYTSGDRWVALTSLGVICTYDEFLAA